MICRPNCSLSCVAISRPTMSLLPPGGNGMIIRIGLVGYCCAAADVADATSIAAVSSGSERIFASLSFSECAASGRRPFCARVYWAFMPVSLTTFSHLFISETMKSPNSSWLICTTSAPSLAN